MKKIIIFLLVLFMFIFNPVNAASIDNYHDEVNYKLEVKYNKSDEGSSGGFWIMLAVAFLAISVFLIAYKSDDDL